MVLKLLGGGNGLQWEHRISKPYRSQIRTFLPQKVVCQPTIASIHPWGRVGGVDA